jgi:hypothetical protein
MAAMNPNQLIEQWVLTFNRGDVEGAQKLYAPNAAKLSGPARTKASSWASPRPIKGDGTGGGDYHR